MTIGERYAESVLARDIGNGCFISLHGGDPGDNGAGMIGTLYSVRSGIFIARGRATSNSVRYLLGNATQGGLASHFGVWSMRREWIVGGRLRSRVALTPGRDITMERGQIVVRVL